MTAAPGPPARELAAALERTGATLERGGRYDDAESLYLRSVAVKEQAFGKGGAEVAPTLQTLAHLYEHQHDFKKALSFIEQSCSAYRSTLAEAEAGAGGGGAKGPGE